MGMSQGNSLYRYLKQTKESFWFFSETENRKAEQVLLGGVVMVGVGRMWG
jgi:hypothetical protein